MARDDGRKARVGIGQARLGALQTGVLGMCAVGALLASSLPAQAGKSIVLTRTTANNVPLMVLTVDINNPNVKISGIMAQGGSGKAEPFNAMIRRSHPTAALTGTFFCTKSLIPIGDIVVDGHLAHRGGIGTGFCMTEDNLCEFVRPPHRYAWVDWSRYDFVCCAGPRLITEGRAGVSPRHEGFRDPDLLHSASRLAVGLTKSNKLIFVATRKRVQLGQLAKAMRQLGCIDALNLDSGASQGFYYNAKNYVTPHRKLTNLILIYDDKARYERFKERLVPHRAMLARR